MLTRCLFWWDVAVHLSFSNFLCDCPSVDLWLVNRIMFSPRPVVATYVPGSVLLSVPCDQFFFRFAKILNGFRWNLREIITPSTDEMVTLLGEIETGTTQPNSSLFEEGSRIRQKIRINVNRCQTSEWIHKIHSTLEGRCDRGRNFTLI